MDAEVGLRELRQNASELVQRAERGEQVTVTVAGRPAAVLGPVAGRRWQSWNAVAEVFAVPVDVELVVDLRRADDGPVDPWVANDGTGR